MTPRPGTIPPGEWGKDHWSLLLYVETRCVDSPDGVGRPDNRNIQTNFNRHYEMANKNYRGNHDGAKFGIRLRDRTLPGPDYDEWDCMEDLMAAGYMRDVGPTLSPMYRMTERGQKVAALLRAHKARGGLLKDFVLHAGSPGGA